MQQLLSRRSLLRSVAAATAGGAILPVGSLAQSPASVVLARVAQTMRSAYFESIYADCTFRGICDSGGIVGYVNPRVFSEIASCLSLIGSSFAGAGLSDSMLVAASRVAGGRQLSSLDQNWMGGRARQAGMMPVLPNDFFLLVDPGSAVDQIGVSSPPVPQSVGGLNAMISTLVTSLNGAASGNASMRLPHGRARLEHAAFRSGGGYLVNADYSTNTATWAALGGTSAVVGATLFAVGTSSSITLSAAAASLLVGAALGFMVVGVGVLVYAAYRIYTQENGLDSVWTKPADNPVSDWTMSFPRGGGGGSMPQSMWAESSICYQPYCPAE